jgi:hypothetical protein
MLSPGVQDLTAGTSANAPAEQVPQNGPVLCLGIPLTGHPEDRTGGHPMKDLEQGVAQSMFETPLGFPSKRPSG